MDHISFDALLKKARELKKQGTSWHFHMIGIDCIFNRVKGQYEIFIENEATGETYSSLFDERPIDQTHQMAKMAYGDDFLNNTEETSNGGESVLNDTFRKIMAHARECNSNHHSWHNHHLLPKCILNKQKGTHCIVFENETRKKHLFAYFDEDPIEELSQLENLYFNN